MNPNRESSGIGIGPPLDKSDADTTTAVAATAEERNESGIGLMANDRIPTVTSEDVSAMELGTETPNPGKRERDSSFVNRFKGNMHNYCREKQRLI